jgi:hypothetical protein
MAVDPEALPPEAPVADAVEQHLPVRSDQEVDETPQVGAEVPEADALEQAVIVPADDEGYEAT